MIQKHKTYIPVQCASLITYILFGGSLNLHLATFLYLVTMVAFILVLSILIVLSGFRVFLVIKVRNLRSRLTKNSSMNLNFFYFNSTATGRLRVLLGVLLWSMRQSLCQRASQ